MDVKIKARRLQFTDTWAAHGYFLSPFGEAQVFLRGGDTREHAEAKAHAQAHRDLDPWHDPAIIFAPIPQGDEDAETVASMCANARRGLWLRARL